MVLMIKLLKYNIDAKQLKEVEVSVEDLSKEVHPQAVKDYIVALNHNQRQWSAFTKGRSEVNHSKKKPHRQKGTGNARQGFLGAPQYKGGACVFGPRPKFDQGVKINKKERQAIIKHLISQKIKESQCIVLSDTEMKKPKTKLIADFLKKCTLGKRVLFVGEVERNTELTEVKNVKERKHFNFQLSLRNLPKVEFSLIDSINGYQLMKATQLVFTETGLKQFLEQNKS